MTTDLAIAALMAGLEPYRPQMISIDDLARR